VVTFAQLTGAAWPAATLACVCRLHAVAVRPAALVSDEKRIRGVYTRRCATQITTFTFYLYPRGDVAEKVGVVESGLYWMWRELYDKAADNTSTHLICEDSAWSDGRMNGNRHTDATVRYRWRATSLTNDSVLTHYHHKIITVILCGRPNRPHYESRPSVSPSALCGLLTRKQKCENRYET